MKIFVNLMRDLTLTNLTDNFFLYNVITISFKSCPCLHYDHNFDFFPNRIINKCLTMYQQENKCISILKWVVDNCAILNIQRKSNLKNKNVTFTVHKITKYVQQVHFYQCSKYIFNCFSDAWI